MARNDYRTKFKEMSLTELKEQMSYYKAQWDKFFVLNGGEKIADEKYKIYSYLKSKIERLES